jgi:hypothetical protein
MEVEGGEWKSHQQDGAHANNGVDGEVEEGHRQLRVTCPCGKCSGHLRCWMLRRLLHGGIRPPQLTVM